MTFVITGNGPIPIQLVKTIDLLPSSPGCTRRKNATLCTVTVGLSPGRWSAAVQTFDRIGGKGTALSTGEIAFRVAKGRSGNLPLVLNGIPHALAVTGGSYAVHGTQATGFTIYGTQTQPVVVSAIDAGGQTIVGPGAPAFAVSLASGTGWSVAGPKSKAPNVFSITPPGSSGSFASFTVTASGPGCTQAGAACRAEFNATNHLQWLFVGPYGQNKPTYMFGMPYTSAPVQLLGSANAFAFAMNSAGDLFVLDRGASTSGPILEYAPPYTSAPIASIPALQAVAIAVGPNDDLFVGNAANGSLPGNISVYQAPYIAPPQVITNGNNGAGPFAFDARGDLFASEGSVVEYQPPFSSSSSPVAIFPSGGSLGAPLAVDANGNVIAAARIQTQLFEFSPPFSASSVAAATIQRSCCLPPQAMTFDDDGNLWAAETAILSIATTGTVVEYGSDYSNTPIRGFTTPAKTLVIDGAGNVITLDGGQTTNMWEFSPPYTGAPTLLASGMGGGTTTQALFLSP